MNLFKSMRLYLVLSLVASVPMGSVWAAQRSPQVEKPGIEQALTFIKDIYTLEYLNGPKGKYRNATMMQKIVRQPGRALATAAVYGLSFYSAKLLYDAAHKHGVFDTIKAEAQRRRQEADLQARRDRLRAEHEREVRDREPVQPVVVAPPVDNAPDRVAPAVPARPVAAAPRDNTRDRPNNVRIANPLPGRQLPVLGLQQLHGFYHMQSAMPELLGLNEDGDDIKGPCGIHAAWNMSQVEARVMGRQITVDDFDGALQAVIPDLRAKDGGLYDNEVVNIAARLHLAPVIALGFDRDDTIIRIGSQVQIYNRGDLDAALVAAANEDINRVVQEFRQTNGARVAHFLCGIPGHWVAISVVRHADGAQAMYLYDNLNNRPHAVAHMRRHIENIYNRFF